MQLLEAQEVAAEQTATIAEQRDQLRDVMKQVRSLRDERENEKVANERTLQKQADAIRKEAGLDQQWNGQRRFTLARQVLAAR